MNSYLIDENRKLHICSNSPDCDGFIVEALDVRKSFQKNFRFMNEFFHGMFEDISKNQLLL